jgi:hypothetical protein
MSRHVTKNQSVKSMTTMQQLKPCWFGTQSHGLSAAARLVQANGNLQLLDVNGNAYWATNTANQGAAPYKLVIQVSQAAPLTEIVGKEAGVLSKLGSAGEVLSCILLKRLAWTPRDDITAPWKARRVSWSYSRSMASCSISRVGLAEVAHALSTACLLCASSPVLRWSLSRVSAC